MNGVEILNKTEIMNWVTYVSPVVVFFVMLGIAILIGVVISLVYNDWLALGVFAVCGLLLATLGAVIAHSITYPLHTNTYQYQVTISDKVNFNEFTNKYNIIKTEGKIYTVEEKQ